MHPAADPARSAAYSARVWAGNRVSATQTTTPANTKGTATIVLEEQPGPVTVMTYTSNVQIGGRIAAVGQRLLESVGKMMTKQALEALNKELKARL